MPRVLFPHTSPTHDLESQSYNTPSKHKSLHKQIHNTLYNNLIKLSYILQVPYIKYKYQYSIQVCLIILFIIICCTTIYHTYYLNTISHDENLFVNNDYTIQSSNNQLFDVEQTTQWHNITHLIIVPGHTVLRTTHNTNMYDNDNWYLESYQTHQLNTLLQHIELGVQLVSQINNSLLLFSGGETRAGVLSEAHSYYIASEYLHNDDNNKAVAYTNDIKQRILTEEYARDSYENILYSICRFYEITSHYPSHITVIGFEFKAKRFNNLHRIALRIPQAMFDYVGIDPIYKNNDEKQLVLHNELTNSYTPFTNDMYACNTQLHDKKLHRNPYRRQASYVLTNPLLRGLLLHCGPELYMGKLPWSSDALIL